MALRLPQGQYRGRATTYGIGETQAGEPQVVIEFDIFVMRGEQNPDDVAEGYLKEGEDYDVEKMKWFGSFKGGARPITIDTLLKLGLAPGKSMVDVADGPNGGALVIDRVYGLSIKDNVYNGTTSSQISSIYRPEDGAPGVTLDRNAAAAKLAAVEGLDGDLEQRRQVAKSNGPVPSAKAATATAPTAEKPKGAKPKF